MGYSEDVLYEILEEVKIKGLVKEFYEKLDKFKDQPKHKHKRAHEIWSYALYRIKGGKSLIKY
tara:strand:+ start:727 stop:915 length:189 start_codon:yes stop_codon:yes gene_type:complete